MLHGASRRSLSSVTKKIQRLSSVLGKPADFLKTERNIRLSKTELAHSQLTPDDVELIAVLVASNPNVESLDLTGNGFGTAGAVALGRLVSLNRSLVALQLGQNNLRAGVEQLGLVLAENATLHHLDVSANAVNAAACSSLGTSLATNSALLSLDLSWNPFGVKGGEAAAALLEANGTLKSLNLAGCAIRADGTVAVAAAMEVNATLRHLDLKETFISTDGARALAGMLQRNATLTSLHLGSNGPLERESWLALADAIEANQTLHTLEMQNNGLGDEAKGALRSAKERSDGKRGAPLKLVL